MSKTVVIGMSGGVDSSVAAYLLKQQGYDVIGLFMHNWEETNGGFCTAEQDYEDVKRVCGVLDIPYYTVNFSKQYFDRVFKYFLEEYKAGRTPNPDVLCNREIKFGPFLDYAMGMGADYIATGHYADVEEIDGLFYLKKSLDKNKDQSYFLNQLNQKQLSKVVFPLAMIEKPEVRKIAETLNLSTAAKKDSTGICFIGERNFRKFLSEYIPATKGDILTVDGVKVGEHEGAMYYTLGQRKGLGIGGVSGGSGRWFVLEKDVKNNILYVEQGTEEKLYSKSLVCTDINWIPKITDKRHLNIKNRYRQEDQSAKITMLENASVKVDFDQLQRAVTPGQYCVFYDGDYCYGGGTIETVESKF